jgi:hypothetical protein
VRNFNSEELEAYIERVGKRPAMKTIDILGRQHTRLTVWMEQEPFKTWFMEDMARHEDLLMKLYDDNISNEELAEFRYLKKRIDKQLKLYQSYMDKISKIKGDH